MMQIVDLAVSVTMTINDAFGHDVDTNKPLYLMVKIDAVGRQPMKKIAW